MSLYGDAPADGPPGRPMITEMPILIQGNASQVQLPPQKKLDDFWRRFNAPVRGKGKSTTQTYIGYD
jgi:hypothetical protein